MTVAMYRSTPDFSLPQTQNTAPVLEFNCLYTHDIRRKQKRWQDGFVRFHTFNKRVMVYDPSRNFVGSAHWTADEDLQQGDEVQLDKEAVAVEVAESIGRTETDLTELRNCRKKQSSEIGSSSPVRVNQPPYQRPSSAAGPRQPSQLKHRSLNTLLGSPRGPTGKATLPKESPFDRQRLALDPKLLQDGRPAKRLRVDDPVQSSARRFAASPKPTGPKGLPAPARSARPSMQEGDQLRQPRLTTYANEIIDLCDDEPEPEPSPLDFSMKMLSAPNSPVRDSAPSRQPPPARSSSPAFQTQRVRADMERDHAQVRATTTEPSGKSACRAGNGGPANQRTSQVSEPAERNANVSEQRRITAKNQGTAIGQAELLRAGAGKQTLRIAASSSKKTLLCQEQLVSKPTRVSSTNTDDAADYLLDATSTDDDVARPSKQRQQLRERFEHIRQKELRCAAKTSEASNILTSETLHGDTVVPVAADDQYGRRQTLREARALEPALQAPPLIEVALPIDHRVQAESQVNRARPRAISESAPGLASMPERTVGAPMKLTPPPPKQACPTANQQPAPLHVNTNECPAKSAPFKSKKPLARAVSLNLSTSGTSTVILGKPFCAPMASEPKSPTTLPEPDAWSREAFDLFTWRPPGWSEEAWCVES